MKSFKSQETVKLLKYHNVETATSGIPVREAKPGKRTLSI